MNTPTSTESTPETATATVPTSTTETPTNTDVGTPTATEATTPAITETPTQTGSGVPTATVTSTLTLVETGAVTPTPMGTLDVAGCNTNGDNRVDAFDLLMLLESGSASESELLFFARCWFEEFAGK